MKIGNNSNDGIVKYAVKIFVRFYCFIETFIGSRLGFPFQFGL